MKGLLAILCLGFLARLAFPEAAASEQLLQVPESKRAGFTLLDGASTGIHFTNRLAPETAARNQVLLNGSGVALGDVDGDGLCDIFFAGLESGGALYRNLGNFRFTNITAQAGLALDERFLTGTVLADTDGDGDLDLLIGVAGKGARHFVNDGRGRFNWNKDSGLMGRFTPSTFALADIDLDGDLDLYVANYRSSTIRSTGFSLLNVNGKRMILPEDRDSLQITPDGKVIELGEPDILYLNNNGRFDSVPWNSGRFVDAQGQKLVFPPRDWGLTALFRDLNEDGFADLYVCNDFQSPDRAWLNDGKGYFREAPATMFRHTPAFSMSADIADINRDGHDDLFAADMFARDHPRRLMLEAGTEDYRFDPGIWRDTPQFERNVLQLGRGSGLYSDAAWILGVAATDWTWSAVVIDVDLDGYEDLLCTTGHMFDTQDLDAEALIASKGPWARDKIHEKLFLRPSLAQRNVALRNVGGNRFEEAGPQWGFNQQGVSHGMALADLDNDGDLDVVVNNLNAAAAVHRNESGAPRVLVRCVGAQANSRGIGARVTLRNGAAPAQTQVIMAGGRYLSSDDPARVFAAGPAGALMTLEVRWPGGKFTRVEKVRPNTLHILFEKDAVDEAPTPAPLKQPLFSDESKVLAHEHHENVLDDFVLQPGLPRKQSQSGPGLIWADANGDGWDELFIGAGQGGRTARFNNEASRLVLDTAAAVREVGDQSGMVAFRRRQEFFLQANTLLDTKSPGSGDSDTNVNRSAIGVADYDQDGALDIFIGGRSAPGEYPRSLGGMLMRQNGREFVPDAAASRVFASAGLVNGAMFADLDDNGFPDLVLACEWGAIEVYLNFAGKFQRATESLGLDSMRGFWTGIAAGDFNNDGRIDLVAGNWGLNTKFAATPAAPWRLYYKSRAEGGVSLFETRIDPMDGREVPARDLELVSRAFPQVRERFDTFERYNKASASEILPDLKSYSVLEVNTLATSIFINHGSNFLRHDLPFEAQLSPVFGIFTADLDGDGSEDIFLSQNFSQNDPHTPRDDAGLGCVLLGDGRGGFKALPPDESGVQIFGDGRGAAWSDYDHDGRIDFAAAQNGSATKLYRNTRAVPGLRVRLAGPEQNPDGIGARVRAKYKDGRHGPVKTVQAGCGYWSQNSFALVFGPAAEVQSLELRWGREAAHVHPVPPGAMEVEISAAGELKVLRSHN